MQHLVLAGHEHEAFTLMIHDGLNSDQIVLHLDGREREALTLMIHDRLNSDQIVLRNRLNSDLVVQHLVLAGHDCEAFTLMIHDGLNSDRMVLHLALAGHEREALALMLHDRLNSDCCNSSWPGSSARRSMACVGVSKSLPLSPEEADRPAANRPARLGRNCCQRASFTSEGGSNSAMSSSAQTSSCRHSRTNTSA